MTQEPPTSVNGFIEDRKPDQLAVLTYTQKKYYLIKIIKKLISIT